MSTMALSLTMCASGYWPETISAAAWGFDNVPVLRVEAMVRPKDGERTTTINQRLAERDGLEGDDVRCILRMVGGKTKDQWTGLIRGATVLIVHDLDETHRRITVTREAFGMAAEWRRPAIRTFDTLHAARKLLRTEADVTLPEAAKAITGRDLTGVEALIAIFNRPDAAQAMREAA